MSKALHLVIGGSGFLGRYLLQALGVRGVGTYATAPFTGGLPFDSAADSFGDLVARLPTKPSHVYLLHGVSNPERCFREQRETHFINVTRMKALIVEAHDLGVVPVYLSSDYVFDGHSGGYTENDRRAPHTVYGRHKAEMEEWLSASSKPYIVARSSKIVSGDLDIHSVLGPWVSDIRARRAIPCATDQVFSPAAAPDMASALIALADGGHTGLFNVAGSPPISRYDLAGKLARYIAAEDPAAVARIQPISLSEVPFSESRPLNTSLSTAKLTSTIGETMRSIDEICAAVARQHFGPAR